MLDPDRQSLQEFLKGKPLGAKALIERYASPLINHATYMLGGDRAMAEDIVQNSFLKLWQNAERLMNADRELQLRAWLFRVTRNQCLDELRKRGTHAAEELDDYQDDGPSAEESLVQEDRAKYVMHLVNRLPERQKSALLMAHFEGMKNPEIARVMECSVEAVENLLARARRSLKSWAQESEVVI